MSDSPDLAHKNCGGLVEIAQLRDDVALYVWCPTCRDIVEAGELIGGPIGGVVRVDRTCTEAESDNVHAERMQTDLRRAESAEAVLAGSLTFGEIRNFIESWSMATPESYAQRSVRERELYQLWVTLKTRFEKERAASPKTTAGEPALDVCECGDFRRQHENGTGSCACGCPHFRFAHSADTADVTRQMAATGNWHNITGPNGMCDCGPTETCMMKLQRGFR